MMRAMPYNLQGKGVVEVTGIISQISSSAPKWNNLDKLQQQLEVPISATSCTTTSSIDSEPTSTLDTTRRSPSPLTSTSTHSSSFTAGDNSGGGAGVADPACAPELHNGGGGGGGIGMEEWESMFPNGEGALLPWIMGETDDPGLGLKHLLQPSNPVDYEGNAGLGVVDQGSGLDDLGFTAKIGSISPHSSSGVLDSKATNTPAGGGGALGFSQQFDEKPQISNPQLVMNPQQAQTIANPSFLMPQLSYCQLEPHMFQPQSKRHNQGLLMDPNVVHVAKSPFIDPGHESFRKHHHQHQPKQLNMQQSPMGLAHQFVPPQHYPLPMVHQQQQLQEQAVKDQLFKAADSIRTGNFSLAQEILARLNHQLSLPAKPLLRAALYVKEALEMLLLMSSPVAAPPPKMILTLYDVVHKMNTYKVFSEVSPITQFVNFTCTQAILEALDDDDAIHIIDFDIGCGAQWASLIQELPFRKRGAPSLKITVLAPLSTSHPFELSLVRENLVQFANELGIAFELQVVNLDLFDPSSSSMPNFSTSEDESIAISIPIWASSNRPFVLPSILRFIKQHSPKIVVSLDRGFDRCDVPFPQHLIHTLESCTNFLESLDGLNVTSDIINKVEKFFIQPRIENAVLGRVHAPDKMPHWKNLFASAGFLPLQFSNFTETQADYVVKKTPGRGFHVEKRQASLVLSWQRRELVAASAWRC